ncbi:MAG TPA: hypothetical protein DEO49_01990 [Sutterella sp.]|nr:hypothetical protein [Sutterella sp.]
MEKTASILWTRRRGSWRSGISLQRFMLVVGAPLFCILLLCAVLYLHTVNRIEQASTNMVLQAGPQITRVQRSLINIENLKHYLSLMRFTTDERSARRAYIDAWSILAESVLDRFSNSNELFYTMLYNVETMWSARQELDDAQEALFRAWYQVYSDAELAFVREGANRIRLHEFRPTHSAVYNISETGSDELREIMDGYRTMFTLECRTRNSPSAGCSRLFASIGTFRSALADFDRERGEFMRLSKIIDSDVETLMGSLTQVEINGFVEEITDIASRTNQSKLLVGVFIAGFLAFALFLIASLFIIVRPVTRMAESIREFRANGTAPKTLPKSPILELQELQSVLPLLFTDMQSEKERNAEMTVERDALRSETLTDPLTQVANRRALELFKREMGGAYGQIVVMMADIDFFKKFNDTYGHRFGDEVLRAIARGIKSQIRSRDHVFRYGGEEFCVILAESDEYVAGEVGTRICDCVRSMKPGFLKNCPTKLTISVGVSTAQHWSGQGVIDELIEQADQALYEAKRTGRDRIVCYNEMQKAGASPK